MPYRLRIKGSSTVLGEVSDEQFARLRALLEEEGPADRDYYIDEATLDYLAQQGADDLALLLGPFVTPGQGVEIEWEPAG
ncbi:MAG: galactosyldiacylglycerol synthase [Chloroflexi bacterium]|nr:galactosyldiacylglycerol synthase [Chloroflexota bacterium]